MWSEKVVKIIPAILFLICLLGIFELGLIISSMNKTEKLEHQIQQSLKMLKTINKIKQCSSI
ncbi:hypothetical protein [Helicobacter phage KHP30]|uniref:Uncharacterized protein n=1 Tax=Helicobacter pylori bacteriophage KHP30 TaxID=1208236 RepID=I7HFW8_BPKHP|nr:hypothetical protein G181_gp20 [Helicobacter phage KHP30]BAM34762.1 hypothetical protein [Helicobacter phage KHP30]